VNESKVGVMQEEKENTDRVATYRLAAYVFKASLISVDKRPPTIHNQSAFKYWNR
jgi:hypothetical protein